MKIEVVYTGQLASAAGRSGETIEVPTGGTLGDLARVAVAAHGSEFAALLCDKSGTVRRTILVAVDGVQATGDRESMPLEGAREVMFVAPVGGG